MKEEIVEVKSNYSVPNLERGLLIIELLANIKKGLTLPEIIKTLTKQLRFLGRYMPTMIPCIVSSFLAFASVSSIK